jgi:hypothetical protein
MNAIALQQKWSRGQVEARLANMPACLIGMEACVGAHHLSRRLRSLGHDARLMPAKYVRPYSKGHNTVVVALASKLARIAWALLRKETVYAAGAAAARRDGIAAITGRRER